MSDRYSALVALLAQPDPPDLPNRGRRYTCAGSPVRRDEMKRDLERAYLRWRMQDAGREESAIVCVRRGGQAARVLPMRKRA